MSRRVSSLSRYGLICKTCLRFSRFIVGSLWLYVHKTPGADDTQKQRWRGTGPSWKFAHSMREPRTDRDTPEDR